MVYKQLLYLRNPYTLKCRCSAWHKCYTYVYTYIHCQALIYAYMHLSFKEAMSSSSGKTIASHYFYMCLDYLCEDTHTMPHYTFPLTNIKK